MSDLVHVREIDHALSGKGVSHPRDPVVLESWRRCVEMYGLDPARGEAAHIVTDTELRLHREQSERLIATARSGLQTLFRQVAGQNYVLLLADAKGICVDFFGDPSFEDELRHAGLYLGSDWSEDLAGTCGVGSCLVTGEAVTIHQTDHFGVAHTPLSCTAAPIYDTCGQLTAVLDISLLRSPSPKSSQNLGMNLVKSSARRIEMANLMAMTRREWVLRVSTSPEFLEVDPEAAVALDGAGRIVGMTHSAGRLLGEDDAAALIGRRIDTLVEISVDDLPDFMRGRPAEDRVLRLKDGRGLYGHAIAPQSPRLATRAIKPELPAALGGLAGNDPGMQQLLVRAARLAPTEVPLLLSGETGIGKERLARAVHLCGSAGRGLHVVHCAAFCMAQLDGVAEKPAGTLLLKGVEHLDTAGQSAILGVLEARDGLRVIATTQTDLKRAFDVGSLRADLYFRIAGDVLELPALRARHDVDWVIDRLLRQHIAKGMTLSPLARSELTDREWPGNIRELKTVIDVAAAIVEGTVIDISDLPAVGPTHTSVVSAKVTLEKVLDACGWNMSRAARRLGVNRSTIMRRVRKSGLTPPQ